MAVSVKEFDVEKSAPKYRSEGYYRERMLKHVREKYADIAGTVDSEILGIACELTGIDDPATALRELVLDSLNQWARIQAIELFLTEQRPTAQFHEEYMKIEKASTTPEDTLDKQV